MKNLAEHFQKYTVEIIGRAIYWYQRSVSPDHGMFALYGKWLRCRFYPSCSAYALGALRQYGLTRGVVVSLKRVARCNPWGEGGYDPIPGAKPHHP